MTKKSPPRKAPAGIPKLTPAQYREERRKRGTQEEVAHMLEVSVSCLNRRENGHKNSPLFREAVLAILALG